MTIEAIDCFLAHCVRSAIRSEALPCWPDAWSNTKDFRDRVVTRILFHGIALVITRDFNAIATWPEPVRDRIREEARAQSFWELGHKQAAASLIETLADANLTPVLTKGTAVAYGQYPDSAARRRGDTDLVLQPAARKTVRSILADCGLTAVGDTLPLQESWVYVCPMGFSHTFDIHWRINDSTAIAAALEAAGVGKRTVALPRLSPRAVAIAPTDNLILIALNRALHRKFGYVWSNQRLFNQERMIWALDIDLLCAGFSSCDWDNLLTVAEQSGCAPIVQSALDYARTTLGTQIPPHVMPTLATSRTSDILVSYVSNITPFERFRFDLAASQGLTERTRLVGRRLFPGRSFLEERFPGHAHWPSLALWARRIVSGLIKMIRSRA